MAIRGMVAPMRSVPPTTILVIVSPTAPRTEYEELIDDKHSIDLVQTKEDLTESHTELYDIVIIDGCHPDLQEAAIDRHLLSEAKVTLVTNTPPGEGVERFYDDVIVRPVTEGAVEKTIESLRVRQACMERLNEQYEVATRLAEAEAESGDPHTEKPSRALNARTQALQAEFRDLFETLSSLGEAAKLYRDLQPNQSVDPPERLPAIVETGPVPANGNGQQIGAIEQPND